MSDQPLIKVLKKRGRKPKNKLIEIPTIKEELLDSDKEVIITYLPINTIDLDEINDNDKDNIFIKSESYFLEDNSKHEENIKTQQLTNTIESDYRSTIINNNFNKINVYNITFNENTKCWWCKYIFDTPRLSLPEQYYDETFFCTGNYCSWECMKAFNIDTNDNYLWKRESLIHLMHYLTYGFFKEIKPASSWLILKDFGGNQTILEFRKNFEIIGNDFIVLHPPLISRQMQIEESYKKAPISGVIVNKLDKMLFENNNNNFILKRNKPIETSQINLEKSMGLKRYVK
jgi:hypothetical protein